MERLMDIKAARRLLAEVVEGAEDTVVLKCMYVDSLGRPNCVVGHVFERFGVDMRVFETPSNGELVESIEVDLALARSGVGLTPAALKYLTVAQEVQDGRGARINETSERTWGDALRTAEKYVP